MCFTLLAPIPFHLGKLASHSISDRLLPITRSRDRMGICIMKRGEHVSLTPRLKSTSNRPVFRMRRFSREYVWFEPKPVVLREFFYVYMGVHFALFLFD